MRYIAGQSPNWTNYEVYLDGEKVNHVLEADDELGKIWIRKKDKNGNFVSDVWGYPEYEVLRGNVEIREISPPRNMQNEVRGLVTAEDIQCETIMFFTDLLEDALQETVDANRIINDNKDRI